MSFKQNSNKALEIEWASPQNGLQTQAEKIYEQKPHVRKTKERSQQSWKIEVTDFNKEQKYERRWAGDRYLLRLRMDRIQNLGYKVPNEINYIKLKD